jgi:hypothetical protein
MTSVELDATVLRKSSGPAPVTYTDTACEVVFVTLIDAVDCAAGAVSTTT